MCIAQIFLRVTVKGIMVEILRTDSALRSFTYDSGSVSHSDDSHKASAAY